MLQHVKHGAINMHPSLLPKYRGPAPIHHALLNGDKTTGVSIIEIDPGAFDVGKILLQKPFNIPKGIRCLE
jgi:methionyl-tRNA formyltransferase